ncbi:hypothetical protein [Streptomyces sp. NPDC050738]|uniref:hypothetical protein n=1 Tax=Streptomyces sp. NPDC050738 TaxID=3154744 RepID=UPI0034418FFF
MAPRTPDTPQRGVPDALLVGVLAFLLGLTILTWLATGLAGFFAHGAWPTGVTFTRTPLALRELVQSPHDLPAAWPETQPSQLSGYGLFWGLLIGEFMVLTVLTIFILGTVTRWRALRRTRKQEAAADPRIPTQHASRPPSGKETKGLRTPPPPTAQDPTPHGTPQRPEAEQATARRTPQHPEGADTTDRWTHQHPNGEPSTGRRTPQHPESAETTDRWARQQPNGEPSTGRWNHQPPDGADATDNWARQSPNGEDVTTRWAPQPKNGEDAPGRWGSQSQNGEDATDRWELQSPEGETATGPWNPQSASGEAARPIPAPAASPQPPMAPGPPPGDPHLPHPPARVERVGNQPGRQAGPTPHTPAPALAPTQSPALTPGTPIFAPAATRKNLSLQAIQDAEGPALVVTSDPTLWSETKDARAKLGPVLVYDPGHLCDTPARLHWSPTTGCEDPDIAAARAIALLAPVRPQARIDATMAETAETLLRSWLHAAAVANSPFKQVHRWAHATKNNSTHEPVRILRTHPKASSGAAGLLESALTAHPERREIAQQLTIRALSALSSIHIRETCTPNRADSLVLESFIDEGGTLYVVGEAIEDPRSHPGAMPLLTALTASVVEHGRRLAARSADGRLDPPMSLVLDDVAAVAPLPRLPELLSNGQDQGLNPLVLLRSREQQRSRWPELNTPTA